MARNKIDYGIDLGTTNSAIARMENGSPVIKKSDTLKDTVPSCVGFNKKQATTAGDAAMNTFKADKLRALKNPTLSPTNTFIEFKRTMGTDKLYQSSNLNRSLTSEELSAEILKKLKSLVTDENIQSIVITVPAKFTINQKDATSRAAKLAGFKHCELLQEPIAASMAYGLDSKQKDGYWLVFDFGGGTFDAALIEVADGIMKVIDTGGDNYLGGKNLDYAIVDELILEKLKSTYDIDSYINDESKREYLREALKVYAEDAKIALSFSNTTTILSNLGDFPEDDNGEEIELDLTITEAILEPIVSPIFQKAIDICNEVLKRKNLKGSGLGALILVGGPTYSPILRRMLKEQVTDMVDTSIDPMTAVANGAALFASTIDISDEIIEETRDKNKIQLGIGYDPTTVEMEQWVTIKLLKEKTTGIIPSRVFAVIERADKAWSSDKLEFNENGEIIEVKLNAGKANAFNVFVYDELGSLLQSEPGEFNIIQGSKIGSATLPYNIGIEIKQRTSGKIVFQPVKGLEKNQSTPAKGAINGLKTQKQIRPGMSADFIKIPIYQGDHGSQGSRAIYNEHVYDALITGEDLPALLPANSDVDLTIDVDKSERIVLSVYFPYLDHSTVIETPTDTVQKEIDANWLEKELNKAKHSVEDLKENGHSTDVEVTKLNEEIDYLEKRFEQGRGDADRKKEVLDNLRKSLKKIDELNDAVEWPKLEEEIKEEFYRLEKANSDLGNDKTTLLVDQLRKHVDQAIREKNIKVGKAVLEDVHSMFFGITMIYQLIGRIRHFNDDFDSLHWKDRSRARQLVNQGLQIIGGHPTVDELRPIVVALYDLLPEDEQGDDDGGILIG
ncbi:MAG: Hsp70 family protein [Chitinophagaceae bacterium]|nr:Hsp70 family protein [Chitinophagaceae bacterium]